MKVPTSYAFDGIPMGSIANGTDAELFGCAADHMLLLWALSCFKAIVASEHVMGRYHTIIRHEGKTWLAALDSFGCPILPSDLRDKLRELYVAAAKEN